MSLGLYIHGIHHKMLTRKQQLYLGGGFSDRLVVKSISNAKLSKKLHLMSTHEKADTRIIIHAIDADKQFVANNLPGKNF